MNHFSKEKYEAIRSVVSSLMAEFGPDGHTDGSDVIAYGVLKALGYDVEYPEDSWNKKELVDSEIERALKE